MRPEVIEQAAAARGVLAPALAHLRAEAVEMRLVVRDAAKLPARDQLAHGEEIAVPAAIVERREHETALLRDGCERARFVGGQRDRLVDEHVLAALQRAAREVVMCVVRRGDHDAFDGVDREQRVEVGHDRGVGVVGLSTLALARGDSGKPGRIDRLGCAIPLFRRL